jgi:predicted amidophosphoribosyltransferase
MPTVGELSALYENVMLSPRPARGVCAHCFNLTDGYAECYSCSRTPRVLAAMAPVSYSVGHEQLHRTLACYKRMTGDIVRRLMAGLAAVLWRYLSGHERCVAQAAGVAAFPLVTVVPSSDTGRTGEHPLATIVSELVAPTRERYETLLRRSGTGVAPREFSPDKYIADRPLGGQPILLIDDTWTTGANAQSAAAALRGAGSGPVAAVVIGRHINRDWGDNDRRLRSLRRPFDWTSCALCFAPPYSSPPATIPPSDGAVGDGARGREL